MEFSLARRKIVVGGALLVGALAVLPTPSIAATSELAPETSVSQFMEISSLLIAHRLDRHIGQRIAVAMQTENSHIGEHIKDLLAIAKQKNAKIVEDFFPDVPDGPLKESALSIISAWYSGVISDSPDAEVFAYELALMYQPTIDVMTIPSYAISGPNGWNADAPPLSNMPNF
ncbi:sugar dehydrogenase complex small subunit [Paraburkholderia sp. RL17-337-BIB-A]|uniref:sugar dehydrogenase complex small subunit n=1 Tax=Paraburkholderia sp. RL17-337-BIB-A TaxID=3031636 RepID=UPI0038BA6E7C